MANLVTTSISALNGTAVSGPVDNFGTAGVIITGTWTGTLSFEGSLDNINYVPIFVQQITGAKLVTSTTVNGQFLVSTSGLTSIRVRMSSYSSGTADIVIQANAAPFLQRGISTLAGNTDGTLVGNVGDRLKVDTIISPSSGTVPTVSSKLRYLDMNVANGGVARETSVTNAAFVTVFSYSGTGILMGFLINFEEKDKWNVRLIVDGEEIFNPTSGIGFTTKDFTDDKVWDLDDGGSPLSTSEGNLGVSMEEHDRFVWTSPVGFPVRYTSSITIQLKRVAGEGAKKFNAGLVIMTKES